MQKKALVFLYLLVSLVACQVNPQNKMAQEVPPVVEKTQPGKPTLTALSPTNSPTEVPTEIPTATPRPVDFTAKEQNAFTEVELKSYPPSTYEIELDSLPISLSSIGNPGVISGLTARQKQFLSQNGFVVLRTGDEQFGAIRNSVALVNGQPYYMTTDAAYHGLHVTFDELLAALEDEYMRVVLWKLLQAEYEQVNSYMGIAGDSNIAADIQLSLDYLAVATKLLYPDQMLDAETEARIAPQIDQIMAYGGQNYSVLIPNFKDDYGAYRPVGHYAGKPRLENYFRAMTWFGRVAFKFRDPDEVSLAPSRAPLIMTLALREGQLGDEPLYKTWLDLHEIINFMIGPSDDPGPMELNTLMESVYGTNITLDNLMDDKQWEDFLNRVDELAAPQINSTFASFDFAQQQSRDWRLFGQVFTLDGFIFQNLIFDKVGTMANPRDFPSGVDVAAAFGSETAYQIQVDAGAARYENYETQMALMQETVKQQPEAQWLNRFYSAWLYAFLPQLEQKDAAFPPVMNTEAWAYKEINSMLGSWAELKHDTVLYAKMTMGKGGGGPPTSGPAPSYLEPNPDVFYRLAYATSALYQGITPRIQKWQAVGYHEYTDGSALGFYEYYSFLEGLSTRFSTLGDIAVKELNHEALTDDENYAIVACISLKECHYDPFDEYHESPIPDPIPVVAAVSGAGNQVLEAGVGNLNRIYVAVPLEGKLQIAQGGVFSYYEFTQPSNNRLTDEAWREKLASNPPALPGWASEFLLPGGSVHDELAFRVGDIYILTEAGANPPLNLRAEPTTTSEILKKYDYTTTGPFVLIIDGPVTNAEGTWLKIIDYWSYGETPTGGGWVLQNPDWFERSYH